MIPFHVITAEPQGASIVERLEEVLEQARAGALSSIAIAVVERDGSTGGAWSDAPSMPLLLGSVIRLAHRLNLRMDE